MNKVDKAKRNELIKELLDVSERGHIGCIRSSANESKQHWATKVLICHALKEAGHDFVTEAWGKKGKWRADILVLDVANGVAVEVLHSETLADFQGKLESYPSQLKVIPFKTGSEWREELLW